MILLTRHLHVSHRLRIGLYHIQCVSRSGQGTPEDMLQEAYSLQQDGLPAGH